jgi:hypothetical protein
MPDVGEPACDLRRPSGPGERRELQADPHSAAL